MKHASKWDRLLFRIWLMAVSLTLTAYGAWLLQLGILALQTELLNTK